MEAPGEKLVIRLWETLMDKGVGGFLAPWQIRRKDRAMTDGVRHRQLILAQTELDIEDLQAGRKTLNARGELVDISQLPSPATSSGEHAQTVAAIARRNQIAREIRGEVNVSKALLSAEAVLEDDAQEPPEQLVDDDWLFRWREAASMVSSDELQALWGRALAGEIKSPGSCSLRTLEFLKNLSHSEASDIAKLSPFVIDGDLIVRESEVKELMDSEGITDGFLLRLQTLGIVSGLEGIGWHREITSLESEGFTRGLVAYDRVLVVTHDDSTMKLNLSGCFLTDLGRQVLRLGSFEPHEGYLRGVGKEIAGKGFKVNIAHFERITLTSGRIREPEEILP